MHSQFKNVIKIPNGLAAVGCANVPPPQKSAKNDLSAITQGRGEGQSSSRQNRNGSASGEDSKMVNYDPIGQGLATQDRKPFSKILVLGLGIFQIFATIENCNLHENGEEIHVNNIKKKDGKSNLPPDWTS